MTNAIEICTNLEEDGESASVWHPGFQSSELRCR